MLHIAMAGAPAGTPKPGGTLLGLQYANSLQITAMELEWVQKVPTNKENLQLIKDYSTSAQQYLTVHAPYFINLNSREPEKLAASKERIWLALEMAEFIGAHSVCVHPAFYLAYSPADTYEYVALAMQDIMSKKNDLFPNVNLALETMGKHTQFGTLEEVLRLSQTFGIYPTIDFAHIHARTNGGCNTVEQFNYILDTYVKYLGVSALQHMHIHYSGIEYTVKGERRHLPLQESDANFIDFLQVLKSRGVGGTLVCESPILETDTLFLKSLYEKITL